ncbi:hypothetical protein FKP32DRAFT_1451521 [Trametes sanguinea]|nr:hypothetical protein FKP32DRAFT_1451521 [Trametes sanguinea]
MMPPRSPSPRAPPPLNVLPSPTAMANAVLPIEICERIIGHCDFKGYGEGYPSLKAFALVCRACLPRALYCLYREVFVRKSRNCFLLLDVLSRYPHRAAWVESLQCFVALHERYLPAHRYHGMY